MKRDRRRRAPFAASLGALNWPGCARSSGRAPFGRRRGEAIARPARSDLGGARWRLAWAASLGLDCVPWTGLGLWRRPGEAPVAARGQNRPARRQHSTEAVLSLDGASSRARTSLEALRKTDPEDAQRSAARCGARSPSRRSAWLPDSARRLRSIWVAAEIGTPRARVPTKAGQCYGVSLGTAARYASQ
jgi:hypothetical protein